MSDAVSPTPSKWRTRFVYLGVLLVTIAATAGIAALLLNIRERKTEAEQHYFKVVEIDETTYDPEVWGRNFPNQYDGYRRTAEVDEKIRGTSEAAPKSKLQDNPRLELIYAGYPFSVDYNEKRGHAFMLHDQEVTKRVTMFKQPGACMNCHTSVLASYRLLGNGDEEKGFTELCKLSYGEAHDLKDKDGNKVVLHPVACIDCHDPKTMRLRVTRPAFKAGIQALARSGLTKKVDEKGNVLEELDADVPHLTSIIQWRHEKRKKDDLPAYDVNERATHLEMRSFVCGQCHVEYYFKKDGKLLTYPWANGLKADEIEHYYESGEGKGFRDWTHGMTKANMLKAQHPEFEVWNQGIHARSGVACADCHMPYQREGAVKISDHRVRSPMSNVARSCQVCHRSSEEEITGRVRLIQQRTKQLSDQAGDAMVEMMKDLQAAEGKIPEERLNEARELHRKAQWRLDFVLSENSRGFHASQEIARLLGESIDLARQAQVKILKP